MSTSPFTELFQLRNKYQSIEEEHLGLNDSVLHGRLKRSLASIRSFKQKSCVIVMGPVIIVLGMGLFIFHAYCTVQASIPLFQEIGAAIVDPANWPKLGGEVPEWYAEIPSEAWFTALAFLVITRSGTANKISQQLSDLLEPLINQFGPKAKISALEDMALTTHMATRTGLFSQSFCSVARLQYYKFAFNPSDRVVEFFDTLHDTLKVKKCKSSPLNFILLIAAVVCGATSFGSAWGCVSRFCQGFDLQLGGLCKSYPEGKREIRLGHYREWFVNTIVFAFSFWIVKDRVKNDKNLSTYREICNGLLKKKRQHLSQEEYFAIKEYLENELERVVKYCVFNKMPGDYLLGNVEVLNIIQTDLTELINKNVSWKNLIINILLYFVAAAPIVFISYLFVMGFTHEVPEVGEHFEQGYYMDHAIGENAEWAFLFVTNIMALFYKMPQFFFNRIEQKASKNVLTKKNLGPLLRKHRFNGSELYQVLEHHLRRVFNKSPLQARAYLGILISAEELKDVIQDISAAQTDKSAVSEYNRLLEEIKAEKSNLFRSSTQWLLLISAVLITIVGLASGYGGLMNLLRAFDDPGYQGEAAEYFWNLIAFCYSGVAFCREAKRQSSFKKMRKVMTRFWLETSTELGIEFHKIMESTLKEENSRLILKQQPSKTHVTKPTFVTQKTL